MENKMKKGFTLIELMVTVAIVGIITVIALPVYKNYIRKGNRQNTETYIMDCTQRLERFYSAALTYNGSTIANQCVTPSNISNLYTINLTVSSTSNGDSLYNLSATAISTGDQNNDTGCTTLSVDQLGNKSPATCW